MRTVVKREASAVEENLKNEGVDKPPPMAGGTSGQPDDPNPRATRIHGKDDVAPQAVREERPEVKVKQFRVTGGPPMVMYMGQSCRMVHGKIVNETSVDIDLLRRQGVVLEELKEEAAEATA
jgi:hypothetical protein